jgi:alcohol dehydrogenase
MWEPSGLYSKFMLKMPTFLFGKNALNGLKNYPASKVAIIHGASLSEDLKEKIKNSISSFNIKFIKKSWGGEPELNMLTGSLLQLELFKPDVIIAVGGGSVIDGAKLLRAFYEFPFLNIYTRSFNMLNFNTQFILIPTTIGSGAEISSASVLYNQEQKTKDFFISHSFIPEIVILDPRFILDAPDEILFSSMLDAISHIVEGYVSLLENPIVDIYAEKALQIIVENWKIFKTTRTFESAQNLQFASVLAGLVQNHCIVGAAHGLAHQLSSYGFSHSSAISIVLKAVVNKNSSSLDVKKKYEKLANACGITGGVEGICKLIQAITEASNNQKERERFNFLLNTIINDEIFFANAMKDKGAKGNPLPLSESFYKEILQSI